MSKYNNVRVTEDGYTFDSKGEHRRYLQLRLLTRSGAIRDLVVHPSFTLFEKQKDEQGKPILAIRYVADFMYSESGVVVIEDVKGHQTDVFRLKWNLLRRKMLEDGGVDGHPVRLSILWLKDI